MVCFGGGLMLVVGVDLLIECWLGVVWLCWCRFLLLVFSCDVDCLGVGGFYFVLFWFLGFGLLVRFWDFVFGCGFGWWFACLGWLFYVYLAFCGWFSRFLVLFGLVWCLFDWFAGLGSVLV